MLRALDLSRKVSAVARECFGAPQFVTATPARAC
jgi:hypothetical protein